MPREKNPECDIVEVARLMEEKWEEILKRATPSYRPFDIVTMALARQEETNPFIGAWSVWMAPGETKSLTVPVPEGFVKIPIAIDYEVYTERKIHLRWWRDGWKKFMVDPELTNFSYKPPFPFVIRRACGVVATNTDDKDNWIKVRFSGVHVDKNFWKKELAPFLESAEALAK